MFLFKKLIFKLMELGLGLRTCFSLETRNPIFVNLKLSPEEAAAVQRGLSPGFTLRKLKFCQSDPSAEYWISYNLYELKYPKKELQAIRKVRCEINTFVEDAEGRKGVYVFCNSPYVSKEKKVSLLGLVCDFAERVVVFIYGCGKLIRLIYTLTDRKIEIDFDDGNNRLSLAHSLPEVPPSAEDRLSDDYWAFNDISFFNEGKTFDLVNVNSAFYTAKLSTIDGKHLERCSLEGPFFKRHPDAVYFHRGDISYIVSSMNRLPC